MNSDPTNPPVDLNDMSHVWKFFLTGQATSIDIPKGAKMLSVGIQTSKTTDEMSNVLYAQVIPSNPVESREFRMLPTGEVLPLLAARLVFIGTLFTPVYGEYVSHVYEVLHAPD